MKRTEITIETHAITSWRIGSGQWRYCDICERSSTVLTLEQAARVLDVDVSEICREVELGTLHLAENGRGTALICSTSLPAVDDGPRGTGISTRRS